MDKKQERREMGKGERATHAETCRGSQPVSKGRCRTMMHSVIHCHDAEHRSIVYGKIKLN